MEKMNFFLNLAKRKIYTSLRKYDSKILSKILTKIFTNLFFKILTKILIKTFTTVIFSKWSVDFAFCQIQKKVIFSIVDANFK